MNKNEVKETRNEVSRIVKKPVENIYGLANIYTVLWARILDLLIIAIPALIWLLVWYFVGTGPDLHKEGTKIVIKNFEAWKKDAWIQGTVGMLIELVSILLFLVLIPSFTNGTTIGKFAFGIRLRRSTGDKKVKWYMLLAREAYFLLLPWLVSIIISLISYGILMSGNKEDANPTSYWVGTLANLFYLLWFVFLVINIKMQSEHQAGIDMKFGLFVVYKDPIKQIVKEEVVTEKNLVIPEQPGNLTKDDLAELAPDEKQKYDKSISLEDLDIEIVQEEKPKEEPKKIENKKDKGDKK